MNEELGFQQLLQLDQAMLAAVLEVTGEVTVQREAVNRHFREKTDLRAEQTAEGFRLWLEGSEQA